MAFDPFGWAIGFTLTRAGGWLLKKAGAETFADRLREAVLKWSRSLPEGLSDLNPEAVVKHLFEADAGQLGPKRQCLAKCFEEETVPEEAIWFEAICERREEVHSEYGEDAQGFFRADPQTVEPHVKRLAKALHRECIKNDAFFRVTTYGMLQGLSEQHEPSSTRPTSPGPAGRRIGPPPRRAAAAGEVRGSPGVPGTAQGKATHRQGQGRRRHGTEQAEDRRAGDGRDRQDGPRCRHCAG